MVALVGTFSDLRFCTIYSAPLYAIYQCMMHASMHDGTTTEQVLIELRSILSAASDTKMIEAWSLFSWYVWIRHSSISSVFQQLSVTPNLRTVHI